MICIIGLELAWNFCLRFTGYEVYEGGRNEWVRGWEDAGVQDAGDGDTQYPRLRSLTAATGLHLALRSRYPF